MEQMLDHESVQRRSGQCMALRGRRTVGAGARHDSGILMLEVNAVLGVVARCYLLAETLH